MFFFSSQYPGSVEGYGNIEFFGSMGFLNSLGRFRVTIAIHLWFIFDKGSFSGSKVLDLEFGSGIWR